VWLLSVSALAGLAGGLASLVYLEALAAAKLLLWPGRTPALVHAVLLLAVGLVISILLVVLGDPGETGQLVDSIHVDGGPPGLRPLVSLVPISLLGIAVGGSIGPEPPLMQTTATIASWIGRRLHAGPAELRVLTVTGLASGLTVLFAAPLGAAIFALEILHRKGLEYYEALLPACTGSLASYGIYTVLTGRGLAPAWQFPGQSVHMHQLDLLLGVCGGLAGAAVAHVFAFLIGAFARLFARLPPWVRPVATAAALIAIAVIPYGLTYGESQLTGFLQLQRIAASVLILAVVGHLLGAAITLAGRWKGGIIIPMFFTGYCLGRVAADVSGHHSYYLVLATSMMVACNTGMTKTPLGSTLVISEMIGLTLIPPLLIAALVSLALTTRVTFVGNQRHRDLRPGQEPPAGATETSTATPALPSAEASRTLWCALPDLRRLSIAEDPCSPESNGSGETPDLPQSTVFPSRYSHRSL
jgi:H+/Cl- antiporter ClcA